MRFISKKSIPYAKISAAPDVPVLPEPPRVNIAVLGSPGVGKTSIIRQFMFNHFSDKHQPTQRTQCYYPSLIINEKLYDVTITDCPSVPQHLIESVFERSDFFHQDLENPIAYVLVFDVSDDESFYYIEALREQILLQGGKNCSSQMLVVGNKHDVRQAIGRPSQVDYSCVVRNQWKCAYVECSARSNWHIMLIFKELMKVIDLKDHKLQQKSRHRHSKHDKRCTIL